jgi:PHD-finger
MDMMDQVQEDDICKKCQMHGGNNWVLCDKCEFWYHFECVGLETKPADDAEFECPDCKIGGDLDFSNEKIM